MLYSSKPRRKRINIITLNAGSSSIKFASFNCANGIQKQKSGAIKNIGIAPVLRVFDEHNQLINEQKYDPKSDYGYFFKLLFEHVAASDHKIDGIGHRVVHGGHLYDKPILLNSNNLTQLKQFIPFAPLHQPFNLQAIEVVNEILPDITQVACFDTAFHRTHPVVADRFAIPRTYMESGVCRYGFHGLSYEYVFKQLKNQIAAIHEKRIIIAHLGNGASMCAIKNGVSIDSTMGFTALDGLMMGTRCGALDPGVVLYFMKFKNMTVDDIQDLLYKKSGLLGVSEISSNMATLLKSEDPKASEAIDLFVYRARREIGALAASLGGLDILIFTGGIGENAPEIRERICATMAWLGAVDVRVIPTDEERMIADHTHHLLTEG